MMNRPASPPHAPDLIGRFAQHKVAANLLMAIMLMAGLFALSKLNRQFFPTFATDFITVRVVWPGAAAEDVSRSVTAPLEQELRNLDNVKEMRSTSVRGLSSVVIEYEEGSDMGQALNQVKEFVGLVRNLPADAEEPEVSKYIRTEEIATIILSGQAPLTELRELAYQYERELLDRGIAKVNFKGLPDEEIAIEVPASQLESLGLSLPQLGRRIIDQSQDIPAGTVGDAESSREVRSLEKRRSAEGFRDLPIISTADGRQLSVGDIGVVTRRSKDNQVEISYQGNPAVLLELRRTENADTLASAAIMQQWLDDTLPSLPPSISLVTFDERYSLVQQRINLLLSNGFWGLILVVLILFVFLNGRVAFWVAAGIPVSLMGTLAVMYFTGGSINMVSLFALIMALGIIVDDAIVVAEDALTHYQSGERSLQAAEGGARRMLVPVMSSSMTTVAAFLPLMLVGGMMGSILKDIPFVIVCVIIASLVESFLILPGHLRHSFHHNHHRAPSPLRIRLDDYFNRFRDNAFRPVAQWTFANRGTTLIMTLCALVLAVFVVKTNHVKFEFFPQPEGTLMFASVKFAAGTPPATVTAFTKEMGDALARVDQQLRGDNPLVETALTHFRTGSFDGSRNFQVGDQYGMVQVQLAEPDEREVRNPEIIKAWRDALVVPSGVEQLSITSPRGGPPGREIDIFLTGGNAETLKKAADEVVEGLKQFDGVTDILDDLPYGKQQYIFSLTPTGQALGFTMADVGAQLRAAFDGQLLQVFQDRNSEVEVRIMLPSAERELQRTLDTFPLIAPNGTQVAISNAVAMSSRRGLELLRHTDGRLGVHVTAEVDSTKTNSGQVLDAVSSTLLPAITQKYGLHVDYKGKAEEQRDTAADMALGAKIGLALIYIILAWVFGSYSWPLAVMLAIPFGLCGAILGHLVMGQNLTILSMFGMFGLSGIVVNDSIILVTFYKELRQTGMGIREALLEAACQRLRAVLLTSLTTIAGLAPLLFESSLQAQFLIPMAISMSFGLAVATLLVLLVIPVTLSLIEEGLERWSSGNDSKPVHRPSTDTSRP